MWAARCRLQGRTVGSGGLGPQGNALPGLTLADWVHGAVAARAIRAHAQTYRGVRQEGDAGLRRPGPGTG
jgi:hypothetical protein